MRTSIDLLEQKKVLGQFPAEASGSHFSDLCQERSVPEFLKELYEKRQKGFKLSLDPLRRAQEKIQWNSKPNCSIQVVGTNGKGTTATAIARSLASKGISVGLFTSPHLLSYRERIQTSLCWPDFAKIKKHYQTIVNSLGKEVSEKLSFFEWTAFIAKSIFREQKVQVEVWEAGLGGRLDATTVFTHDILALTSIGRDHEQILGSTPLQVCKEKLAATGQDTAIFVSSQLNADAKTSANLKKWIQSESGYLNTKHFVLADADLHQTPMQANLELATAVRNFVLSNHELDQREQQTHCFQFYGRNMSVTPSRAMQEQHPSVVSVHLDVCHNIDALKTSIDSLLTGEAILFYSCLQDKFSADILHALQQAKVPFALFASGPKNRALLPECIANHPDVNFFASMEEGLASAWFQKESSNGKDLKLCVWGSFFGIEDFLRMEPSAIKSVKQSSSAGAKL